MREQSGEIGAGFGGSLICEWVHSKVEEPRTPVLRTARCNCPTFAQPASMHGSHGSIKTRGENTCYRCIIDGQARRCPVGRVVSACPSRLTSALKDALKMVVDGTLASAMSIGRTSSDQYIL
jgi:hypothetical protein